jgi:transposase
MLVVETIAKIRRAYFVQGKSIKAICRDLRVSRKTVRKVLRSEETEFAYERRSQPQPKIGPWREELDRLLAVNAARPSRERLTLVRVFEELRGLGYDGGYDAVRRYAADRRRRESEATAAACVPLSFAPGEAYQFDWSHEVVVIDGVTTTVKVAHVRLCHSRMMFVRAYPRETQEMVFDAHDKAFAFFGGACTRGIYDSGHCPPLVRGQWTRRPRWMRSSRAGNGPTTGASSRCADTTSWSRSPARPPRAGRRARSRTRWARCASGSSRRGSG